MYLNLMSLVIKGLPGHQGQSYQNGVGLKTLLGSRRLTMRLKCFALLTSELTRRFVEKSCVFTKQKQGKAALTTGNRH